MVVLYLNHSKVKYKCIPVIHQRVMFSLCHEPLVKV